MSTPASSVLLASLEMLDALEAIRDDLRTFGIWEWHTDEHNPDHPQAPGGIGGACSLITQAIAAAKAAGIGA